MDGMLQRHCARYIYIVPEGLRELMNDISREVLRSQPSNIYSFIADYLDALMITRENARVAARLVQNIQEVSETIVEFLTRTSMSREEADRIVAIIQTAFRNYLDKKHEKRQDEVDFVNKIIAEAEITPEKAEEAALIIQTAFQNFKIRKEREQPLLAGIIDWRVAARSAIKLYRKTGVSHEEASSAATLIKAAYKGYYTRRMMKNLFKVAAAEEIEKEDDDGGASKPKSVRINFDTVRSRVDFEDVTVIADDAGSAIVTAKNILEEIINVVTPDDESRVVCSQEIQSGSSEQDNETETFVRQLIIEEILPAIFEGDEKPIDETPRAGLDPLEVISQPILMEPTDVLEQGTSELAAEEPPRVPRHLAEDTRELPGDTSDALDDTSGENTASDYTGTDYTDTPRSVETTEEIIP